MLSFLLSEESSPLNNECLSKATIHRRYCLLGNGKSFYLLTNGSSITEQNWAQCKAPHVSSATMRRSVTAPLPLTVMKRMLKNIKQGQAQSRWDHVNSLKNVFNSDVKNVWRGWRLLYMCELALDDWDLVRV